MEIIVGMVAALVATLIVRGLIGTARPRHRHFDGEYVSPDYRARTARQSRSEFDANRLMTGR